MAAGAVAVWTILLTVDIERMWFLMALRRLMATRDIIVYMR
jgi:hypothetical protein